MTKIYRPNTQNISQDAHIGEECTIHSHVWIGGGVVIGDRCKIQAFAFIPDGVVIGNNVFIGPHVCFTNDQHPSVDGNWKPQLTAVHEGVAIGANATILPGVIIGKGATIGAGSVVTKSVPAGETWIGNPAKKL